MKAYYILILSSLFLSSCDTNTTNNRSHDLINHKVDLKTLRSQLFEKTKINSTDVLNQLASFADNVIEDTAKYVRTPKSNLYISSSTNSYFQVFENPKGTITAIAFYADNKEINVAEYFKNGQIMCRFSTTEKGQRNGAYECYNEDGTYRTTGFFQTDHEIKDSLKRYDQ